MEDPTREEFVNAVFGIWLDHEKAGKAEPDGYGVMQVAPRDGGEIQTARLDEQYLIPREQAKEQALAGAASR